MTPTVFDTVSLFLRRFTTESIHSTASIIDLGLDSIHLSELEFELQRVLPGAGLQHGFTLRLATIGDIVQYIERMNGGRSDRARIDLQRIPLSPVQSRILFLSRLHPENSHQFLERISFSAPNVDRGKLEIALRRIVMRHAIMRTCYEAERQFALSGTECNFSMDESTRESSEECIDIEKDPPIRVRLRKTGSDCIICIDLHHIAVDGRSNGIFLQELKMMYGSASPSLMRRPQQYIDDSLAMNEQVSQAHIDYWKEKLSGIETQLLHIDFRRKRQSRVEGNSIEITIPPSLMASLQTLRRQSGSTSFALLLSIYRLLIYKSSGYDDFPMGVMVENRNERNRETMGCFVNTCVLRSQLNPSTSFTQFVRDIQQNLHDLRHHSSVPFDDVVSSVQTESDGSTSPLFQILFVMDNVVIPSSDDGFGMIKVPSATSKYEQTWYITNYGAEMSVKVEYRTDLFTETTIRRNIGLMLFLMQKLPEESGKRINEISLSRPIDILQFHEERKENARDCPDFNHVVQKKQEIVKVRFKNSIISTKKIRKISRRIAQVLQEEYISHYGESPRPDVFLVLFVERSIDLIPLVLGGIEAGFCIAPISLDWSIERRREVLEMIGNAVYVTDSANDLMPSPLCLQLSMIMDSARILGKTRRRSLSMTLPSDLLYATFTSGTTGMAKCVCTSGEGMGNLLLNYTRLYCVSSHSSIYQVINYAFDIFFCDLFLSLANNADLTLASGAIPEWKEMERASTTHCFVMPAFLNFSEDGDLWSGLDTVLVTGETMQRRAFRTLLSAGVPLNQLYGATEQTINNTSQRLHIDSPRRGVGSAYHNLSIRSVDKDGLPMPHFWPALVRYSGMGMARGVFGQSEKSKSMFPLDECLLREETTLREDRRCFDSGDLLRKNEDGNLTFVGRNDHLRKIRGRAVDLREVEHHLSSIREVSGCLVRLTKDSQRLIAYIVSDLPSDTIKMKLSETLPSHMIPDQIIKMKCFPTNANGKIDVKALPEPLMEESQTVPHIIEPRTSLENQLSDILKGLLKKKISLTDDFFSSGGNSLLAMLAVQKMESELRLHLPLNRFFQLRSIAKIAEFLEDAVLDEISKPSVDLLGKNENIVEVKKAESQLDPITIRAWPLQRFILERMRNYGSESFVRAYNITARIRMKDQKITQAQLRFQFNRMCLRHPSLRTFFVLEGVFYQRVVSATECFLPIGSFLEDEGGFDVFDSPPIAISLAGDELHICISHLNVDGYSMKTLVREM
ncbi:hypothetical protein PENTCL1PPCAC_18108, partial [Pristionchus entomophagus]